VAMYLVAVCSDSMSSTAARLSRRETNRCACRRRYLQALSRLLWLNHLQYGQRVTSDDFRFLTSSSPFSVVGAGSFPIYRPMCVAWCGR